MIANTKTGVLLAGTIGKAPELRRVGQNGRPVLKFSLRYGSEEDSTGKHRGKYIDVNVWSKAEELDGMLAEDDAVVVIAREIKSREYNGKTYYSVSADGVFPGAEVVFRWMQQIVDMLPAASPPAIAGAEAGPMPDFAGHELYAGERLSHYAPKDRTAAKTADLERPIEDAEDLPF